MFKRILFTVFLLCTLVVSGQAKKEIYLGNLVTDSGFVCSRASFFTPITQSRHTIELRVQQTGYRIATEVAICYDTLWKIIRAERTWPEQMLVDTIVSDTVFRFFTRLVEIGIFSLPDQMKLEPGNYFLDVESGEIIEGGFGSADGVIYRIEFKVNELYRSYSFWDSDNHRLNYPTCPEFSAYAAIEVIFREIINMKHN